MKKVFILVALAIATFACNPDANNGDQDILDDAAIENAAKSVEEAGAIEKKSEKLNNEADSLLNNL